jgi:ABC-type transport system involved in cytochrome bd biosynthesis fused ATPase/permease subunit
MKLLFKLVEGKTLIMVSHKLENLKDFDCIYVLENGEIVEKGDYESLSETRGSYFNKLRAREKSNK